MKIIAVLFALVVSVSPAFAQNCGPYPNTLTNGQPADANQVMANFNTVLNCLNAARKVLTSATTYYVRTDGNDSNNGLANTSGSAFLTIQRAINVVQTLDLGGQVVTIQVGAGTYTGGVSISSPFIGGTVALKGDATTPSNVVISTTAADAIVASNKSSISVQGFKLSTTTSGHALFAQTGASIKVDGKMEYGAAAGFHVYAFGAGSQITIVADYAISGGAPTHLGATDGGSVTVFPNGRTITLTGTPAFTYFAYASRVAGITAWGHTFSGAATGVRYNVDGNSVVFVNGGGASYLPGNAAGTTSAGGQYY